MSTPLIRQVKAAAPEADLVIVDLPPGTSCPVMGSARGVDFVLLVTKPTPFCQNDLKLAVGMIRAMKLPFGVAINRAGRVRYDRAVTTAQVNGRAVVEYQQDGCAEDIRSVWRNVAAHLEADRTENANLRVQMPELRNPI